jgi:hypothetical protein
MMIGIFSPFKHENTSEYLGYDITQFEDNIRFAPLFRDGGAGTHVHYISISVNYFHGTLPQ